MPLTPLDIHNKEFSKSFRGYDQDEVNEFLNQIIKDYEALIRQNKDYEEKIAQLTERLNHFSNIEESINKSIIVAQDTAEEVKANAKKEAQLIVKEAEKNADRIINDALMKSRNISLEIEELKKRAAIFRTRFRTLVEAQLELLDNQAWEELDELSKIDQNEVEKV
ncbi:hypothetical protein BHF71_08640 [Vulcanibacillus modesticaldus]|uniref:Septum formation initiator n=1 Tax=Vulcanibacillus modesticaldus TaxID=337097 RepID=A0A1D2YV64_9BACI|nr:DivIVA domain-containing protein [Vulcanibacillus modesticaldus]OEF99551.1 hypothetical protein BHF71_08640 [Vulcanibacillus modesticaldus]